MYLPDGVEYPGVYRPLPDGVHALAVGWLDAGHAFNVGAVWDDFVARLFEACRARATARTRDWHRCELCSHEDSHEPVTYLSDQQTEILKPTFSVPRSTP
jgi:hypothetical protein